MKTLLEIKNLNKIYTAGRGLFRKSVSELKAVEDLSFDLKEKDTLAIVGESGCGKSTTAKCIIRLTEPSSGEVIFDGIDLTKLSNEEMRLKRRNIQMIYQDPYSSLNPRMKVKELLAEPLRAHKLAEGKAIIEQVREIAGMVGLSTEHLDRYPHQFSGGQRQRISIGRALISRPKLLLADEPVSALDVSIQAQILNLLTDLQKTLGLTMLFISHDLNVVRHISRQILVMYLGRVMESGPTETVFENPMHPYTKALLDSIPVLDPSIKKERKTLKGDVLSLAQKPEGCPFSGRCINIMEKCKTEIPPPIDLGNNHIVSCFWRSHET
ncbi:MAG: ATP-binding cassette domain-containing protein [Treponema sp.]|nr:ATP-binding cassette domain-containing protein [Treponema sp.]